MGKKRWIHTRTLSKSADMLWKAWRFESKLRKLAGNFNGGLAGCRGEHRRINCKRLYRRLSRIFKAPLSPIHTRSRCVCMCVRVYTSRCVVIVGGLIKACYAASRPSNQTRRRFNIYENYPIVSNIVRDRWIDATRWVLKIVVRLFYAGFRRRFMRLAHACTPCYGLLRDEE